MSELEMAALTWIGHTLLTSSEQLGLADDPDVLIAAIIKGLACAAVLWGWSEEDAFRIAFGIVQEIFLNDE